MTDRISRTADALAEGLSQTQRATCHAAMLEAATTSEVWDVYAEAAARCGFTRMLYGCIAPTRSGGRLDLGSSLLLHRGPQAFLDAYISEELYLASPMVAWILSNDGFKSNAEIAATTRIEPTPKLMRLMQLRNEFQSGQGYVGAFRDVLPGVVGGISLHCDAGVDADVVGELWRRHSAALEALSRAMHLRVATLPHPLLRPLTTRQREALDWVSRGKTARDIATILDLSEPTVEKHLRGAREALDAATTAHAVRKAMQLNLLRAG